MALTELERVKLQVEAWKVAVQVQQHFNNIEMRVRALAITVITAVLAAAGVALKNGDEFEVLSRTVKLATALVVLAVITLGMFYMVDQVWYHRLLLGAVRQAESLENLLQPLVPGIGLTRRISQESPYPVKLGKKELFAVHSNRKALLFYLTLGIVLIVFAYASAAVRIP